MVICKRVSCRRGGLRPIAFLSGILATSTEMVETLTEPMPAACQGRRILTVYDTAEITFLREAGRVTVGLGRPVMAYRRNLSCIR